MILHEIIKNKRIQLEMDKRTLSIDSMKYMLKHFALYPVRSFKKALTEGEDIAIIGEIKQASPSKGLIRRDFSPLELAQSYINAGVQAISVLTEKNFFKGNDEYLSQVRKVSQIPILRKDFIIDPWQIYQARVLGADAILLIASILSFEELVKFYIIAKLLGMDCLVEVHDREELDMALKADVDIIGINNRNLHDFSVDLRTTERLLPFISQGKTIVSESGIQEYDDVKYMRDLGIDALLVGEALMREDNINDKVMKLRWGCA